MVLVPSATTQPPTMGRAMMDRRESSHLALVPEARDEDSSINNLGQRGAMALAKRLEQYWHSRGYPAARFWAEPIDERFAKIGSYKIYCVKCNLVDGLPPRYRDEH